jgi:hypothetical protein
MEKRISPGSLLLALSFEQSWGEALQKLSLQHLIGSENEELSVWGFQAAVWSLTTVTLMQQ